MIDTPEDRPRRFVLLKHVWNGVHWDFMLESDGILRTWALDAPPSPGVVLDARELPDHRTAYLDYEGPISGGRGSVQRIDGGVYELVDWADDCVRVQVRGRQLVGEVLLTRDDRPPADSIAPAGPRWKIALGKLD